MFPLWVAEFAAATMVYYVSAEMAAGSVEALVWAMGSTLTGVGKLALAQKVLAGVLATAVRS